jgi:hypothetical protein
MSLRRELQRLERKRSLPFHHAPIWPVLRRSQLTLDFHSDEHPVCLERFCPPPPRWRKIPLPIPSLSLSPPSTTTTSRKSSSPTAPLPLHASARPQPLPPSLLRHSQRLQSSREAITIHMEELVEGERSEGISEGYRARVQEGIKGRTAAGRTRSLPATQAMGRAEEEIRLEHVCGRKQQQLRPATERILLRVLLRQHRLQTKRLVLLDTLSPTTPSPSH